MCYLFNFGSFQRYNTCGIMWLSGRMKIMPVKYFRNLKILLNRKKLYTIISIVIHLYMYYLFNFGKILKQHSILWDYEAQRNHEDFVRKCFCSFKIPAFQVRQIFLAIANRQTQTQNEVFFFYLYRYICMCFFYLHNIPFLHCFFIFLYFIYFICFIFGQLSFLLSIKYYAMYNKSIPTME